MQNSPEHNPIQNRRIPVLGFCRGMQMLAVISGAEIIQDLPAYFAEHGWKYNDELCIQTIQAIERPTRPLLSVCSSILRRLLSSTWSVRQTGMII